MADELIAERGETYKVFDLGGGKKNYICRCKPIHYTDEQTEEWKDIDVTLRLTTNLEHLRDDFLASENKFTVGFRADRELQKTYGIRYRGKTEYQFESTPVLISLGGKNVALGTTYQSVAKQTDYEFENTISDTVSLQTKVHEVYVQPVLKVSQSISDFLIREQIDLTGFKITNAYAESGGVREYIPDAGNKFFFDAADGEKMWIPQPVMWDDAGDTSIGIHHRLYEKNGVLYYEKTATAEGKAWLESATGTLYIDATSYYGDTKDGYTELYDFEGTWAEMRSEATPTDSYDSDTRYSDAIWVDRAGSTHSLTRVWLWFDTSGIDDGATVTDCDLKVYGYSQNDSNCSAQKSTQPDSIGSWTMTAFSGSEYGHSASWSTSGYNTISFNATGKSEVNKTGDTKICLREYEHDYLDVDPSGSEYMSGMYFSDWSGTSYDPYLSITVSAGGAPKFDIERLGLKPLTNLPGL